MNEGKYLMEEVIDSIRFKSTDNKRFRLLRLRIKIKSKVFRILLIFLFLFWNVDFYMNQYIWLGSFLLIDSRGKLLRKECTRIFDFFVTF